MNTNAIPSLPWHYYPLSCEDIRAVEHVLRSGHLSVGKEVPLFECAVARYVGRQYGVAMSSGTSALHLMLMAMDLEAGSEVIVPSLTFAATVNAILMAGLCPVYADVEPETLTLSPPSVARALSRRTRAILAVDLFGQLSNWKDLALVGGASLPLLEDACQALGSRDHDGRAGSFGLASTFSFFPNKLITTGEGGMLVTDSKALADHVRRLRNQGRALDAPPGIHQELGTNCRMSEFQAALGRSLLGRISTLVAGRRVVERQYRDELRAHRILRPALNENASSVLPFFPVLLPSAVHAARVVQSLSAAGLPVRRTYIPVHQQASHKGRGRIGAPLAVSEDMGPRIVSLPMHPAITPEVAHDLITRIVLSCHE